MPKREKVELELGWSDIYAKAGLTARLIEQKADEDRSQDYVYRIYGVPRGGIFAAQAVISQLHLKSNGYVGKFTLTVHPGYADFFVDDIIDSGETEKQYKEKYGKPFLALVEKDDGTYLPGTWITFPWERMSNDQGPQENIRRILQYIGEDPNRDGLKETPDRVIKSYSELFGGYKITEEQIKGMYKTFEDGSQGVDEMIVVKNIPFTSTCEHHMLQFSGVVHVGYIPSVGGKILGLSKFARIVDVFAARLQVQEALTTQIATSMWENLSPLGVAVVMEAEHSCMRCRGVKKHGTSAITSKMMGVFREPTNGARSEFLSLVRK